MLVYKDLLTEDELLDDSFARREIENGMLWEVEGKWVVREAVHVDIHANPSAKGAGQHKAVDDKPVKVIDIVDTFQLQEKAALDKDQFMEHMQRYREKLMPKLEGEKQEQFKKNIEAATDYLMNNLSRSKIYVGESMHEDCSLVFMCYKEGASDPTFLYLAAGLKEIKS